MNTSKWDKGPGDYSGYKLPPREAAEENAFGVAEMRLSNYLTRELTRRPAVSLSALYESHAIQQEVGPILVGLERKYGKQVKALTEEYREGGVRRVMVRIVPR